MNRELDVEFLDQSVEDGNRIVARGANDGRDSDVLSILERLSNVRFPRAHGNIANTQWNEASVSEHLGSSFTFLAGMR